MLYNVNLRNKNVGSININADTFSDFKIAKC
jgi:hypothetical protein